uniref:Uncharacterized protein n=1 Tax=Cacopsylla melanoneura TaxID=428564 RepID=A0A8D8QP26_9HEMI
MTKIAIRTMWASDSVSLRKNGTTLLALNGALKFIRKDPSESVRACSKEFEELKLHRTENRGILRNQKLAFLEIGGNLKLHTFESQRLPHFLSKLYLNRFYKC